MTDNTVSALRDRYLETIERRADLLDSLLQDTEAQRAKLQEENLALRETVERLRYKLKCAHYELRKALGVKATTNEAEPEETVESKTADDPAQSESPGSRKRGAPKGHRGRSRPVPEKVDFTEIIPPPAHCDCGCENIEPLDAFDSRYIEDIPPVSRFVTERKYQRGRCPRCGKQLRHDKALRGPPTVIGPNLAVHLTMLNQMGTTFRKLSAFSTHVLGVDLSASGALGLVNRVGHTLAGSYHNLGETLRKRHCIIHSIVETCKLQNKDPIEFIRMAYTSGGLDVPDICNPPAA